jgi:hypothetical protein
MLRYLLAAPFLIHGLAHLSGFLTSWTGAETGFSDRPWIISSRVTLSSGTGRIFGLFWLLAAVGFVLTAYGLAFQGKLWIAAALPAAAISLLAVLPWLRTVPPGAWVGAAFDLAVIVMLVTSLQDRLIRWIR